jgi:hypothetical protein
MDITNKQVQSKQEELRRIVKLIKELDRSDETSIADREQSADDKGNSGSETSDTDINGIEDGIWEELRGHRDYQINTAYPYHIRKKSKPHRYIKECQRDDGYVVLNIDNKILRKHVIVASQWLDNPMKLPAVDHINHEKADFRVNNLRWASPSDNNRNKTHKGDIRYEFVTELPEGSIEVSECNGWRFKDLYYKDGDFYVKVNAVYRKLAILGKSNKHVNLLDTEGTFRAISINVFKRELDNKLAD